MKFDTINEQSLEQLKNFMALALDHQTRSKRKNNDQLLNLSKKDGFEDCLNLFKPIASKIFNADLNICKMILYLYARELKDHLLSEAFEEGQKRKCYFKYTVAVIWRSNSISSKELDIDFNDQSGRIDTIYWYERIGHKIKGRLVYHYIKIQNRYEDLKYTVRDFKGAEKWELEIIKKYEEKFALIRKLSSDIGAIKRGGYHLQNNFKKLISQNQNDFTKNNTQEENLESPQDFED